jgi:archaellum component FlaF (FlaF/FlaG flagellin family)
MEIEKEITERIITYYDYLKEHRDVEFEMIIRQGNINSYDFMSVLQYLRSINLQFKFHEETLSINFRHKNTPYRYEIVGKSNINSYCSSNDINTVSKATLVSKTMINGKYPIYIDDYGLKINMKNEEEVVAKDKPEIVKEIRKSLYSLKKVYRLKKRFSFFSKDNMFRFDLTVVKSSKKESGSANLVPSFNLISSGIFQSDDEYEIEVEFLRPENNWPSDDNFISSLFNKSSVVLRVLDNDDYIISNSKKKEVVDNYKKLTGMEKSDRPFIGPMPITLEMKNLLKPDLGINSILEDYTVTDKADGERHLLFIDSDGKVYLINNRMNVKYTGLKNDNHKNSLIDGEYITKSYSNRPIKVYAAFDIYFDKGEDVCTLPLMSDKSEDSRIKRMNNVTSSNFSGDKEMQVTSKEFLSGNIFQASQKILNKSEVHGIQYYIDGLIYTPKYLPVGAAYKDAKPTLGGSWIKVFKWKPPHDNTIDFLVKTETNDSGSDIVEEVNGKYNKVLNLYVGYDIMKSKKVTPKDYLLGTIDLSRKYVNIKFNPPEETEADISRVYVPLDGNNTMRTTKTSEIIMDGRVVEFAYQKNKWVPLRLRPDKTMGNDFSTAVNIWKSIKNPVTENIITGKDPININADDINDNDLYYNRVESRDKSASASMLDFHNYWVKNMNLVAKFKGKAKSVFDIACGKGSDRYKYLQAGFTTIVGVDKSEDNIVNPVDGAYSRIIKSRPMPNDKSLVVFLPLDCSKVIDANYINAIKDEDTKDIFKLLWGMATIPKLEKYHALVSNQFDLVACQFAIHYFFENKVVLNAFISNVDSVLKEGGYFVGTCLDGLEVDKMMRENKIEKGNSVQGRINDRVLWDIKKNYDSIDTSDPMKNFGLKIDVYMETINQRLTEYLVDFRLLEIEFAKRGIRLLTPKEYSEFDMTSSSSTFKDLFHNMIESNNRHPSVENAKKMKPEERSYSFLNRWFIFKKDTSSPPQVSAPKRRGRPPKKTT